MKRFILSFLMISILSPLTMGQENSEIKFFEGSWAELLETAKKKKKPIFVDFYTSWCGYCKKMDHTTFKDSSVTKYVKGNYLAYKVNAEKGEGPTLARKYHVSGYPTVLFFDHKGNMIGNSRGFKTAQPFLQALTKYKEQSRTKIVADISEDFSQYIKVKRKLTDELEEKVEKSKSEELKKLESQALEYGKENDHFMFGELKYDVKEKPADIALRLEVKYYQGRNDQNKYVKAVQKLIASNTLSDDEVHYYILILLENEVAGIHSLRAINRLALKKSTFDIVDTKCAVQLLFGDFEDAKETANKAMKLAKKKKKNNEGTKVLLSIIDAEG